MTSVSATIITLDEEDNIVECIRSLAGLCDEVIVLDSNSSDNTCNLAKKEGATVHSQKYLGDGKQKARAAELASNDWIFSIDADERPDEDLRTLLPKLNLDEKTAYAFRRKNFLGSRQIKAADFYPNYVTRLYNRKHSNYQQSLRHASVISPKLVKTQVHLLHYTYKDVSDWIARINWLTSRDSLAMYQENQKLGSPFGHALAGFLRMYLAKGGCFHGQDGLTVSMTTAFFSYMKYLKLRELYDKQKSDGEEPRL